MCVYVCMYVCVRTCVNACVRALVCACVRVCVKLLLRTRGMHAMHAQPCVYVRRVWLPCVPYLVEISE